MNYSENDKMCRVDFFKNNGKWYATEAIEFVSYTGCIQSVFRESLRKLNGRYENMRAVCLNPCHEHSHPITCLL